MKFDLRFFQTRNNFGVLKNNHIKALTKESKRGKDEVKENELLVTREMRFSLMEEEKKHRAKEKTHMSLFQLAAINCYNYKEQSN